MLGNNWVVKAISSLDTEITWDETGTTFESNAKIKVEALMAHCQDLILGDDSGLEVDALNGEPGVYSSRYAGADGDDAANNQKLIKELADTPDERRTARFRCCLCLLDESGEFHYFNGSCEGTIGHDLIGNEGFGYDPLFYPEGSSKTLAEYPAEEKNKISHRAKALQSFLKFMAAS